MLKAPAIVRLRLPSHRPLLVAFASLAALAAPPARALEATYAWNLASGSGVLRSNGVLLSYDAHANELFVLDGGLVRVFSQSGMEIYAFGDDARVGPVRDLAALENGDLVVLSGRSGLELIRCNFRGEPIGRIAVRGLPPELAGFSAAFVRTHGGKLYLADPQGMKVAVVDPQGAVLASYDLAAAAGVEDKREETGIRGFAVDPAGNILFTIQPLFQAFVMAPDGQVRMFGTRGSAPGKFNVIGAIASDERGNLYVADVLRAAVLVFGPDLQFVREFGYRGDAPGNLAAPVDLAVGNGRLFVSQYARRGVSVFNLAVD